MKRTATTADEFAFYQNAPRDYAGAAAELFDALITHLEAETSFAEARLHDRDVPRAREVVNDTFCRLLRALGGLAEADVDGVALTTRELSRTPHVSTAASIAAYASATLENFRHSFTNAPVTPLHLERMRLADDIVLPILCEQRERWIRVRDGRGPPHSAGTHGMEVA